MKSPWTGAWLLGGFGLLIIVAFLIVAQKPPELIPMDTELLKTQPMPLTVMPNLPILAPSMPAFRGITRWWNTENDQPLTAEDLEGKVVMVDFWTYSCINCIRTQPFMRKIWDTYKDDGLVIVGVHTPEFAFEKVPGNVEKALREARLEYPIALDPDYATWNAYNNRYWPAAYFFDRQGRLRFTHFGEGDYDRQEEVIRELLAESGQELVDAPTGGIETPAFQLTKTPETYFGYRRLEHFANHDQLAQDVEARYELRETQENEWSLGGVWRITPEYAAGLEAGARFRMNVESDAMHLVLGTMDGEKRVRIAVDGKAAKTITVTDKTLYTVAEFPDAGRHVVELELLDGEVEFYAATFGKIVSACDPQRLAAIGEGAGFCAN